MYQVAKPEKKQAAGSLLMSAALTAMLTGITEPLEFTFIFVAPFLYAVHSVLAGAAYMFMHILNVGVGMTFSGGRLQNREILLRMSSGTGYSERQTITSG